MVTFCTLRGRGKETMNTRNTGAHLEKKRSDLRIARPGQKRRHRPVVEKERVPLDQLELRSFNRSRKQKAPGKPPSILETVSLENDIFTKLN